MSVIILIVPFSKSPLQSHLISGVLKIHLKLDSTLDGSTKWSSPIDEWWLEVTALLDAAGVGKLGKAMDSNKEKQIVRSLVGNIDTKALRDSIRLIDPSSIRELYTLLSTEGVSHDAAQLVFRKFNFVATAAPNNAGARNNDNSARNGDGGKKDSNRNPSGDKGKSNTSEEAAVKADNNAKRGASESEKTDGANVSQVKCWGCGDPGVLIYNCKKASCILENAANNAKKEAALLSKSMATGGGARGKDNKAASNSRNQAQVHMLTAGEDTDLLPLSAGIVRDLPPKSLVFSQGNTTFIEDEADFDDNRKKYADMISVNAIAQRNFSFASGLAKVSVNTNAPWLTRGSCVLTAAIDSGLTNIGALLNVKYLKLLCGKYPKGNSIVGLEMFTAVNMSLLCDGSKNPMAVYGQGYLMLNSMQVNVHPYGNINILRSGQPQLEHSVMEDWSHNVGAISPTNPNLINFYIVNLSDDDAHLLLGRITMTKLELFGIDRFIAKMQSLCTEVHEDNAGKFIQSSLNNLSAIEREVNSNSDLDDFVPPWEDDDSDAELEAPALLIAVEPVQAQSAPPQVLTSGIEAIVPAVPVLPNANAPSKVHKAQKIRPILLTQEQFNLCMRCHSGCGHRGLKGSMKNKQRIFPEDKTVSYLVMSAFIERCPWCQLRTFRPFGRAQGGQQSSEVVKPGARIYLDYSEMPLDSNGRRGFVAIVDAAVHALTTYACSGPTAENFVKAYVQHISIYPPPVHGEYEAIIYSDNGAGLTSDFFRGVVKASGADDQRFSVAYNSQDSGSVETFNGIVKQILRVELPAMLKAYGEHKEKLWADYGLPAAGRIIMDSWSEALQCTPRQLCSPLYAMDNNATTLSRAYTSWQLGKSKADELIGILADAEDLMLLTLARKRAEYIKFLRKSQPVETPSGIVEGDLITVNWDSKDNKRPNTLALGCKGIFRVLGQNGVHPNFLRVESAGRKSGLSKIEVIHISRAGQFILDPRFGMPVEEIDSLANNLFRIECFKAHTGDPAKRTKMRFLVHYLGWNETHDEWMDFEDIKCLSILNDYIDANPSLKVLSTQKKAQLNMFGTSVPNIGDEMKWDHPYVNDESSSNLTKFDMVPEDLEMQLQGVVDENYKLCTVDSGLHLTQVQRDQVWAMLEKNREAFSSLTDKPCKHPPIEYNLQRPLTEENKQGFKVTAYHRKHSVAESYWMNFHIEKMLKHGMIEELSEIDSADTFSSIPLLMVPEPHKNVDGKPAYHRLVFDASTVNRHWFEQKLQNVMPNPVNMFELIEGKEMFYKMDGQNCFSQFALAKEQQDLLRFRFFDNVTRKMRLFRHTRVVLGVEESPRLVQQAVIKILRSDEGTYMDDLFGAANLFVDMFVEVDEILQRAIQWGYKISAAKTFLFERSLEILGREHSKLGVKLPTKYLIKVENWKLPRTKSELQGFCSLLIWSQKMCKNQAIFSDPLRKLISKAGDGKNAIIEWTEEAKVCFHKLKLAISLNPIMASIDPTKTMRISADACIGGRGGMLWQLAGEDIDPSPEDILTCEKNIIAYFSESHSEVMRRWPTVEQEAGSVHWLLKATTF